MSDAASISANIAKVLAATRSARKLSLQTVADRSGLSKSHVWEIEAGRSVNPTIDTAVGLARALGVTVDYLIGLSTHDTNLHPEAMRIACEVDALLRKQ